MKPSASSRVELLWFFGGEAESALGLRGVTLEPSGGRDPHAAAELAERRADAAARYSEVSRRLERAGAMHERVLRLAFTPHRWPGLERWYELAGVGAFLLERDRRADAERRAAAIVERLERLGSSRIINGERAAAAAELEKHRTVLLGDVVEAAKQIGAMSLTDAEALKMRARRALGAALAAYAAPS